MEAETQVLFQLAQTQKALGNLHAARSTLQRLVKIDPTHAEAWYSLGLIQTQYNLHEQAAFCYQQSIRLKPLNFGAHANLGNALFMLGKMEAAISIYRQAIHLEPGNITVYCNLGMALSSISHHDEAIACFKQALELDPNTAEIHIVMANTLTATGAYEEALSAYSKAAQLKPGYVDALAGAAGALEKLGRHEDAHRKISPLVASGTNNSNVAFAFSAISKHFGEEKKACLLIENLLKKDYISASQRLALHFAAGDLLDRLGEYDAAFSHFEKGNNIVPHQQYNPGKEDESFDAIINIFSKEFVKSAPRSQINSEKPVFIIGMPRSGTSLVEQILSSHPQVFGAGELNRIQVIVDKIGVGHIIREASQHFMPQLSQLEINTIAVEHLKFLQELSPDAMRIVDKMPHNFLHVGLISLLFPHARIIHCTRNPLDTCLSIYFQYFGIGNDYAYKQDTLGEHYCNYRRLMKHWQSLRIPMLDISYEMLVSNQEEVSRKIVEYCGLEWDERCLQFHKSKRVVRTASYDQVRRPIHSHSVNRWRNYENHLTPLISILQKAGII